MTSHHLRGYRRLPPREVRTDTLLDSLLPVLLPALALATIPFLLLLIPIGLLGMVLLRRVLR